MVVFYVIQKVVVACIGSVVNKAIYYVYVLISTVSSPIVSTGNNSVVSHMYEM